MIQQLLNRVLPFLHRKCKHPDNEVVQPEEHGDGLEWCRVCGAVKLCSLCRWRIAESPFIGADRAGRTRIERLKKRLLSDPDAARRVLEWIEAPDHVESGEPGVPPTRSR